MDDLYRADARDDRAHKDVEHVFFLPVRAHRHNAPRPQLRGLRELTIPFVLAADQSDGHRNTADIAKGDGRRPWALARPACRAVESDVTERDSPA